MWKLAFVKFHMSFQCETGFRISNFTMLNLLSLKSYFYSKGSV